MADKSSISSVPGDDAPLPTLPGVAASLETSFVVRTRAAFGGGALGGGSGGLIATRNISVPRATCGSSTFISSTTPSSSSELASSFASSILAESCVLNEGITRGLGRPKLMRRLPRGFDTIDCRVFSRLDLTSLRWGTSSGSGSFSAPISSTSPCTENEPWLSAVPSRTSSLSDTLNSPSKPLS